MFSYEVMFSILGFPFSCLRGSYLLSDVMFADRAERVTFNALPVCFKC